MGEPVLWESRAISLGREGGGEATTAPTSWDGGSQGKSTASCRLLSQNSRRRCDGQLIEVRSMCYIRGRDSQLYRGASYVCTYSRVSLHQ